MSGTENFSERIREGCVRKPGILAFPESFDPRIAHCIHHLLSEGSARKIFVFHKQEEVFAAARQHALDLAQFKDRIAWVAHENLVDKDELREALNRYYLSRGRQPAAHEIIAQTEDPLYQAGFLLTKSMVEGVVAGCHYTTASVIKAGLATVGLAPGITTVSGSFVLEKESMPWPKNLLLFADSGVVIDPNVNQLVDIAASSVRTWKELCKRDASVAFLSFSTHGSARHPFAEKMREAANLFKKTHPDIVCDGELQFDAAFDAEIGLRKCPDSEVPGKAQIFVFPDLNAGNIAYKIAQQLGGYRAYGPLLQGLTKPFHDLSRGATKEDIVVSSYIAMTQAASKQAKSNK
jgi:phosphate acetyltransferase